jgi:hypothetical protein
MTAHRLFLLAVLILPASRTVAQTLPWPTGAPQTAAPPPEDGAPPALATPAPTISPTCRAEFAKLREDVQKLGLAAKAAGQRKVGREEMCKHITVFSAAYLKWVKYTEANVTSCGISAEVVSQLKQVHSNTEKTKERICSAVHDPGVRDPGLDVPSPGRPLPKLPSPTLHIACSVARTPGKLS